MAGVDLRTVAERMGHSSIQMTVRYAHLAPRHNREALTSSCLQRRGMATEKARGNGIRN
jgi:site-specific recombinase XerD